ncbi:MAG: ATP-binding protein [Pseudomonadaceae bacterium]|nr:ATP-binding protein [Pseudomonadaceae bacterium]
MTAVHIIEGPVGAGKTTYALKLAKRLPALSHNLDQWMVALFQPDRPSQDLWAWYGERKQRCIEQIWHIVRSDVSIERDVIVELGLVTAELRAQVFERAEALGCDITVHLLDAPTKERAERVRARNEDQGDSFSMRVSEEVFTAANAAWEPLNEDELAGRPITLLRI